MVIPYGWGVPTLLETKGAYAQRYGHYTLLLRAWIIIKRWSSETAPKAFDQETDTGATGSTPVAEVFPEGAAACVSVAGRPPDNSTTSSYSDSCRTDGAAVLVPSSRKASGLLVEVSAFLTTVAPILMLPCLVQRKKARGCLSDQPKASTCLIGVPTLKPSFLLASLQQPS